MARPWTKDQRAAIDTRDRTLLVSAAAGSGKTATLTERIIESILDDKNPMDIGRMLITTFTNKAVDELRERIGAAIHEAAASNPDNKALEAQALRLKDAKILTIASFCNTILRSCAESAGLPPNYRIAEPAEAAILFSSTAEGLIEAAYEGELAEICSAEEFFALADCLTGAKTEDSLSETVGKIYTKLQSTEHGVSSLKPLIDEYDPARFTCVEKTRLGEYAESFTRDALRNYEEAYSATVRLAFDTTLDNRNLPKVQKDLDFIKEALATEGYEQLREAIRSPVFDKFSKAKGEDDTDFYVRAKVVRDMFKGDIADFNKKFFSYTTDEWRSLYSTLYKHLLVLYRFLEKLDRDFSADKKRRGICEFADVERYAYRALYNDDGSTTELADELRERFDAIYVDEYQDVNGLQSKVFSAISKPTNRFMVGDIKQSIYVFRSARPEIFAAMKNEFPLLGTEGDFPAASIFMSKNFRCDKMIVDFVNGIFDTMFGLTGKSIGYKPEDRLDFAKVYKDGEVPVGHVPEIHLIEKASRKKLPDADEAAAQLARESDADFRAMADSISRKIVELLNTGKLANGKPIKKKDICIMMHSVSSKGEILADSLKAHGISSTVENSGDLFMSEEVLLALSFLYSIDNPRRDVYLAALMCSPLFEFSPDELLCIRRFSDAETLWEAINEYSLKHTDDLKVSGFIESLKRYRKLAEGQSTDALISLIFRESGLLALAARSGGRDNLVLFHSYARRYEQTSFKGLYSFLSYISEVIAGNEKLATAKEEDESDSVSIITIHKSKGLEFPVCFLANASARAPSDSSKLAFTDDFGIALRPRDDTGLALVDNPAFNIVSAKNGISEFEEDLRVLYVALTRARERLYIYANTPRKNYIEEMAERREFLSPYFATTASSLLDIIMLGRSSGVLIEEALQETSDGSVCEQDLAAEAEPTEKASKAVASATREEYLRRFTFRNPLGHLETVPEKISVSKLKPNILDGCDDVAVDLYDLFDRNESASEEYIDEDGTDCAITSESDSEERAPMLPKFITGKDLGESAKRGIATHMVMQFCDLDSLLMSVTGELDRLVSSEFISREDRERVRVRELEAFVRSPLFREMKGAARLYRELRFNAHLPAASFTTDEELAAKLKDKTVLVQGVIDCIIEAPDGSLHLIDYKTDRLTREQLASPALADKRLRDKHKLQLSYYADAIAQMFGKRPARVGIYSLHAGREIELEFDRDRS